MEKAIKVLEIVMPIFVTIALGILAKRKNQMSEEGCAGLQQFVMKFCLPCVLFNSCLTANFGMESITAMAMVIPMLLLSCLWSFSAGKKRYPYYNLPQLFSAQETGMLGIPLFMTLFGAAQAYRMGVLDVAQAVIAIPVISILSADAGENPSVGFVVKKVFQSPLLLMSLFGLVLNLTGAIDVLNGIGVGGILTEVTGFLAQPVSAVILFCVGYNFSMGEGNTRHVFEICVLHFVVFAVFDGIIQAILCFVPNVAMETRWAMLLYCALPGSYLAAGLVRTKEESILASNVCSILTIVCLIIFCVIAAFAV